MAKPEVYISREIDEELEEDSFEPTGEADVYFCIEMKDGDLTHRRSIDGVVEALHSLYNQGCREFFDLPDLARTNPMMCNADYPTLSMERYPLLEKHRIDIQNGVNGLLPYRKAIEIKKSYDGVE